MPRRLTAWSYMFCCLVSSSLTIGQTADKAPTGQTVKPDASAFSDEPYVFERVQRKIRLEADGKEQRELTVRVRVQSEAAVKQFGLLVYPFMASFESLEVLYARVGKPDGTVVETPATDVQELDSAVSREAPMYTDQREKHIAIKALGAGDVLEVSLRWTGHDAIAPGHFWYDDDFIQEDICLDQEIEINVPETIPVRFIAPSKSATTRDEDGRKIYTLHSSNLKKQEEDEASAWEKNFYGAAPPAVRVSSFSSWAEVGAWYGGLQQPRVQVTPAIRAKAEELVKGKVLETEKIQAIYGFVATRIRYIGIDLGMGRYTPHAAEEVLANRYGDCKDKHTLFAALLEAVGVKAYPALISTGYKIDAAMPSASLFDHVVTAIPHGETYLFLDTTPEVAPYGLLLAGLRDREALVVPPNGAGKLVKTPADPPIIDNEKYRMDASISAIGTLDGKARWEDRGDSEVLFRSAYRDTPRNQWKTLVQNMVGRLGFAGTVSDVVASEPESTTEPFWFTYTYHREGYSDWEHHRITLPFPPFLLPELNEKQKALTEPLPLGARQEVKYEAWLKLPDGVTPSVPGNVDRTTEFADYTATYSFTDGVLRGTRQLVVKKREIPGTERSAWSSFVKAVLDDEQRWIFLSGEFGAEVDVRKGLKLLQDGKTAEAVAVLEKQAQDNPNNVWFKLMLGRAYLRVPDEAKAMELFHGMLNDSQEDPAGLRNAVAYELASANVRVSEAVEYATRAVQQTEADTMKVELASAEAKDYGRIRVLAAHWDTLGLAKLKAGDTATAEKYIWAAWLLWQRAVIGEHLVEVYEKQGKKTEAARACAMALAAPGKDDEADTRAKLGAAQKRLGVPKESYTVNGRAYERPLSGGIALTDLRAVRIPLPRGFVGKQDEATSATFAIAVENGAKTTQVKFISGSEELRAAGNALETAKIQLAFPDQRPTRILRKGLLSCSKYTKECTMVLFPLENELVPVELE